MSGVQMSDFISKIGHLDPRFYSLIYCDTGGPDVGGPDVGGPDVGGPDVGGPDVGGPYVRFPKQLIFFKNFLGLNMHRYLHHSTCVLSIHSGLTIVQCGGCVDYTSPKVL